GGCQVLDVDGEVVVVPVARAGALIARPGPVAVDQVVRQRRNAGERGRRRRIAGTGRGGEGRTASSQGPEAPRGDGVGSVEGRLALAVVETTVIATNRAHACHGQGLRVYGDSVGSGSSVDSASDGGRCDVSPPGRFRFRM